MSRAGKFIPGGGGTNKSAGRTDPIRAPDPSAKPPVDPSTPPGKEGKRLVVPGSGLRKPVAKGQKLPIVIMSAFVCCMLVSVAWYTLAYLPAKRQIADIQHQLEDERAQAEKDKADAAAKEAARLAEQGKVRGTLTVATSPTGATVTIGDFHKTSPANFADIIPGTVTMVIRLEGYEEYREDVTISADKPSDLGTIQLLQKAGSLALTTPQSDVSYTITGPADFSHDGKLPDKFDRLPIGDYVVTASQKDWKLAPVTITVHDHDNIQKDIKFPYANISLTSVPTGATVRQGHTVLGQTPLNMTQVHPGEMNLTVDLAPYTIQAVDLHIPDFGNVIKQVKLAKDKDFIAANGMPMVWIPEGNFYAGKYEVRQSDFETVTGYNPSNFHRPTRPVETVSWESAQAFINKLNAFEQKAGKVPQGYHYSLPKESQWDMLNADASIDDAATSRVASLNSTQDSGYSSPNKYGLFDTLGNVWEWCLDDFDDKGNHTIRGGCWLSSPENFTGAEARQAAPPKYADKFIGLRVVLVHD